MGGPETTKDVEPFLLRLFSDKDLIPIPFQAQLAPYIAKRRTPKIIKQYSDIGGGSPIKRWTSEQGSLLTKLLDKISPESAPHKPYIAFRYAPPLTADTIQEMKNDGITRAVALSLYPQFSCSTTGSSLNELYKHLQVLDPENSIAWSVIDRWPTHSGLVNTFARHIQESLETYTKEELKDVVIIFSAHSLPMSVVNRGDTYPVEVAATVDRVMNKLGHSHSHRLVWQSQVGPSAWLGPKTEDVVSGYAKQGKKNLLVVPIAFVSDHVETLYELDLEYGELAKQSGIGYKRVESLNADPEFIKALGDIVKSHLNDNVAVSKQFQLRCPMCVNETCGSAKEFFTKQELMRHAEHQEGRDEAALEAERA